MLFFYIFIPLKKACAYILVSLFHTVLLFFPNAGWNETD